MAKAPWSGRASQVPGHVAIQAIWDELKGTTLARLGARVDFDETLADPFELVK